MLRPLVYALIIYFGLLAMMAYGRLDHFYYWIVACSLSSFLGMMMGNLFGGIHLREMENDEY